MRKGRRISIPFWSDFNHDELLEKYPEMRISIPFWSDFNLGGLHPPQQDAEFQSHFGLILTPGEAGAEAGVSDFNPILV